MATLGHRKNIDLLICCNKKKIPVIELKFLSFISFKMFHFFTRSFNITNINAASCSEFTEVQSILLILSKTMADLKKNNFYLHGLDTLKVKKLKD